jgi:catechol 2,3-dioxygenase-like lactoylglutathione lyase family enzyme
MSVDWDWTRVVIDHVHIRVRDAQASVAFYKAVLATLGIPPIWEDERGAQLANLVVTDGEPYTSGPVHIAFGVPARPRRQQRRGSPPRVRAVARATRAAGACP